MYSDKYLRDVILQIPITIVDRKKPLKIDGDAEPDTS
jgi:hypothetical protein